jgi:hypothetical protein
MILNNSVNAGGFIYCMAYLGPNESVSYFNQGDGHFHQWFYIVDGRAFAEIKTADDNILIETHDTRDIGPLVNQEKFKGKSTNLRTEDSGISIMFFNPIPETRELDVEIVKGPAEFEVSAVDNRITLVAITGPIQANDKTLLSMQHAKIFPDKTVSIKLEENAVCALVT